ncbi:MAG: Na+/H+ antiporter NhaC [Hamadaea sp.]|nr:Na+/H+ antiporter NhaC [Hamadaea sp.]NUR50191.1 Na+/H+ antiporter NhaC [Hamadaea sp.]NUT04896.1 Na+/H+ antiporter NhaC [Hamadaea sp.]
MPKQPREPSLLDAIIPLVVLAGLIAAALALFGLDALDGPIQAALIVCVLVAGLIGMKNGHTWADVERAAQSAFTSITSAVLILLAVGALIGIWNLSGTIPTLVYYGIQVLSPSWYYAATAIICGAVAMSIGSSWTTAGTIGAGLIGVAAMLGVSPAITAGAVISGAYLGDKLSPLSETTILTAQMVKVDVHEHIKRQAWTSVPAFVLATAVFLVLSLVRAPNVHNPVGKDVELAGLGDIYHITPWNLLPLVLLAVLSIRKVPATLALMVSALFAGILGAFLQPQVMRDFVGGGEGAVVGSIKGIWAAMANGFEIDSGIGEIDRLLSRGGMDSMLPTLWLIIGAVTFGAVLEEFGLINRLVDPLIRSARSTGRLFVAVFACGFGLNVVAGDQYIALVLPSRVFRLEFEKRGLAPTNLSRLAADSATVTSPLVPWNSCGAFMGAVLGVPVLSYLPYAIFNYASPALSVLYGITGFRIEKAGTRPEQLAEHSADGVC